MNTPRTSDITQKRLELAEKYWLSPLIDNLVKKTKVSTDVALCYFSRDPTVLWSELKALMITASNFLWQSQLWRELSKIITSTVYSVYVPLYSIHTRERIEDSGFFENLSRWLSLYEDIIEILKKLTSTWLEKHKLLSKIEDYVNSGWVMSYDLKWLKNIINTI